MISNATGFFHMSSKRFDVRHSSRLMSLGARTDIRDCSHNSTAAGFAAYSALYDAMRLLPDSSDSLLDVVGCACLDRAKTLYEPADIKFMKTNLIDHVRE